MLYPTRLHVINRVSQLLVQEVHLTARALGIGVAPSPLGFVEDVATGTLFVYMGKTCNILFSTSFCTNNREGKYVFTHCCWEMRKVRVGFPISGKDSLMRPITMQTGLSFLIPVFCFL